MNTIHELVKSYSTGRNEVLMSGSIENCMSELNSWKSIARRNGASIYEEGDDFVTYEDYAGNDLSVTFYLNDTQEELFD